MSPSIDNAILKIKKCLWLWLLPKLNNRACGGSIPRSGEGAKKVNCFSVYLNNKVEDSTLMLVDSVDRYRIIGRRLDMNQSFTIFDGFSVDKIAQAEIEILHHYGIYDFVYHNIYSYFLLSYLGWDRLRANYWNFKNTIAQWVFNLRRIDAGERYKLLKFLVLRLGNRKFRVTDVMLLRYGRYIFNRRDYRELAQETSVRLNYLVDTNELKVNTHGEYSVSGQGWKSISDYEENDRRITAESRIQWALIVLSAAVALLTAGQADVIKFSTLWDLRSEVEKKAQEPKREVTQINNYYQIKPSNVHDDKKSVNRH